MSTGRQDLDEILDTLREVEASLTRRVARAEGANIIAWSVAVASTFAFYQLVEWDHEAWHAALGPLLPWVWVGPLALAYVASAIIGARLGRATRRREVGSGVWRGLFSGVLGTIVAAVLVLTESYDYVYGSVTLICGLTTIGFTLGTPRSALATWSYAVGAAMVVIGGALLAWPVEWAPLVAALAFLLGLGGLGTVRYRLAG